jgi:hypothetical protein
MKAIKILIITIISVLVLGCAAVVLIYFYTDTFKTNKEIFYKYMSEQDSKDLLDTTFTNQLLNKIKTTKNEQNIKTTVDLNNGEESSEGEIVKFNNKVDLANNMLESKITLQDSNEQNQFECNVVKNDDEYGLTIADVLNGYLAIENKNLNQFAQNLQLDSEIKDKIDTTDYENQLLDSENKISDVFKIVYNTIKDNTDKTNYSKLGKATITIDGNKIDTNGYELNLTADQFKGIVTNLKRTKF